MFKIVLTSGYLVGISFPILNYVIDFVMNIFVIPILLWQIIRLKEISKRLEE